MKTKFEIIWRILILRCRSAKRCEEEVDNFSHSKSEFFRLRQIRNHNICLWFQLRKGSFINQVVGCSCQYIPGQKKIFAFSNIFWFDWTALRRRNEPSRRMIENFKGLDPDVYNVVSIDELKLIYFRFDFSSQNFVLK